MSRPAVHWFAPPRNCGNERRIIAVRTSLNAPWHGRAQCGRFYVPVTDDPSAVTCKKCAALLQPNGAHPRA